MTYFLVHPPCGGSDGWLDLAEIALVVPLAAFVFALPGAMTTTYLRNGIAGVVAVVCVGFSIYRDNTSGACETIPAVWFVAGWIPPTLGTLGGLVLLVLAKDLIPRFTKPEA
jgi:hypothetical protein